MRWVDATIILSWFVVSRLIAAAAGVTPDAGVPALLWQLLPLELLEHRLVESLWYLHSQPPLFNAFVGLLLMLPGDYVQLWRASWIVVGALFPLTIFATLRVVHTNRWIAHALVLVVSLNPTLLLYENFLFYSYPEALFVVLGFYGLLRAGSSARGWTMFAVAGSVLTLFRATFQPAWALAIVGAAAWATSGRLHRRQWGALLVPLAVATVFAVKNGLVFGVWSTSSWYGMNVAKLVATAMLGETPRLVDTGIVTPLFAIGPFQPVDAYPPAIVEASRMVARDHFHNVPAVTDDRKSNGQPNFNHAIYLDVSRRLWDESISAARARPVLFDDTVRRGLRNYAQPASQYVFLEDNRRRLLPLESFYVAVLYPGGAQLLVQALVVMTLLTSATVWAFEIPSVAPLRLAAGYVFVTVLWVSIASNLAEFGENSRLRFALDPLMVTWTVVLVRFLLRRSANGPSRAA